MLNKIFFIFLCLFHPIKTMDQEIKSDHDYETILEDKAIFFSKYDYKNHFPLQLAIKINSKIPRELKNKVLYYLELRASQRLVIEDFRDESYISALFFFDENRIVAGFENGLIEVWDILGEKLSIKFLAHESCITSFMKVEDDFLLSYCKKERLIKAWDIESGICIKTIKIKKNMILHNISFDEAQKTIKIDTLDFSPKNANPSDIKIIEPKFDKSSSCACCIIL